MTSMSATSEPAAASAFFPQKIWAGPGDGGMITTNDPELAERYLGAARPWQPQEIPLRSGGDEQPPGQPASRHPAGQVQASRGPEQSSTAQCRSLSSTVSGRPVWTSRLLCRSSRTGLHHVYNQFVIRTPERDQLREHLRNCGHTHRDLLSFAAPPAAGFRRSGLWPRRISAVGGRPASTCWRCPCFHKMTEEQQKIGGGQDRRSSLRKKP